MCVRVCERERNRKRQADRDSVCVCLRVPVHEGGFTRDWLAKTKRKTFHWVQPFWLFAGSFERDEVCE